MLQNHANLRQIRAYLQQELGKQYPERESESLIRLILDHSGFPSTEYLRDPEQVPESHIILQINEIVTDIHSGKPIQYILGYTHFFDLKIEVNENVLIPRPETEEMVFKIKSEHDQSVDRIVDLGTGSGCIALALKYLFPKASVSGMEVSRDALDMAVRNGHLTGIDVNWIHGDILNETGWSMLDPVNLVVSNPPYVRMKERELMDNNVLLFEPEAALFVEDHDPLIYYQAIASFCKAHLAPNGVVWVEINEQFGGETAQIFKDAELQNVVILKDIHEKDRFITARKSKNGI